VDTDDVCHVGATGEETESLSKDLTFEILKNQRRREALAFLKANDGATTLSDMAEHIAAKENGISVEQLSSSQRKRVYIGLYQCHLPKMDSAGVVDFEKNRGTIEITPLAAELDTFLADPDETAADPVPPVNLAFAVAVAGSVAAGLLGIPGFEALSAAAWAVVSTLALVALTTVETVRSRRP
jgi:hypothetical protein